MTQFAPKHLSEKLQAAGCQSESGWGWPCNLLDSESPYWLYNKYTTQDLPAFTLLDLIGPSEQARENAVKWWGDKIIDNNHYFVGQKWRVAREKIVDLNSDAEAWEYVERTGRAA